MIIKDNEILLIGLPEDAKNPKVPLYGHFQYRSAGGTITRIIPEGDYDLIGIWPDLSEEQAQRLVESRVINGKRLYLNYTTTGFDNWFFATALESLATRMQKAGALTVNPYGDEPIKKLASGQYGLSRAAQKTWLIDKRNRWQEAESRVFKKWGILKKR